MKLEGTWEDTSSHEELLNYGVATGSCGHNRQVRLIKTSTKDHFRHSRGMCLTYLLLQQIQQIQQISDSLVLVPQICLDTSSGNNNLPLSNESCLRTEQEWTHIYVCTRCLSFLYLKGDPTHAVSGVQGAAQLLQHRYLTVNWMGFSSNGTDHIFSNCKGSWDTDLTWTHLHVTSILNCF